MVIARYHGITNVMTGGIIWNDKWNEFSFDAVFDIVVPMNDEQSQVSIHTLVAFYRLLFKVSKKEPIVKHA